MDLIKTLNEDNDDLIEEGESKRENSADDSLHKRGKSQQHLSPYQKFKNRALNQIKEKENWIDRIMETIEPKIDKKGVNELSFDQKVKMGKVYI